LSSYDPLALRRGLRHIEALVAQLTLPLLQEDTSDRDDSDLIEFLQLQDSFEWNGDDRYEALLMLVCQRLLTSLDRLIAKGTNEQTTLLLLSTLDLMQGLLLIHPPSRRLFVREVHMTVEILSCGANDRFSWIFWNLILEDKCRRPRFKQ
jgi:Cell division control protein 14, SIN component